MSNRFTVADITHPYYDEKFRDWQKWRYTYEGGQRFIDNYLKRFSAREDRDLFQRRKSITYNPAFAKQAIDEIKNSIFQRLVDIRRVGGSDEYNAAITGEGGGVDMVGSSMNAFIGQKILPELLVMSRVGVFVDMPEISGLSVADAQGNRPYVYIYRAEDIRSWTLDETNNENEFTNILLRDYVYVYDDTTGLPSGLVSRFRRLWLEDGRVRVQFYNQVGSPTDITGSETLDSIIDLSIDRIPFIICKMSDSLLADVANYQIALLNLGSSDLMYSLMSNFPFYTEQFHPNADNLYTRKPSQGQGGQDNDGPVGKVEEIKTGISTGRRYPKGFDRPGFIHPSPEPLKASMEKQEQLKIEIRQLVALSVSNMAPQKQASADSKAADQSGLENGLAYIGLELENMERKIASYWAMYKKMSEAPSIYYPETYTIKSQAEINAEVDRLLKVLNIVPSQSYARAICRQIAELVLGRKVKSTDLGKIMEEINKSKAVSADPLILLQSVTAGICSLDLAAELFGYPQGTTDDAADDHADRLERISAVQTPDNEMVNGAARGVPELGTDPGGGSGKSEKQASTDTTQDPVVKKKQRGKGKRKGK